MSFQRLIRRSNGTMLQYLWPAGCYENFQLKSLQAESCRYSTAGQQRNGEKYLENMVLLWITEKIPAKMPIIAQVETAPSKTAPTRLVVHHSWTLGSLVMPSKAEIFQ